MANSERFLAYFQEQYKHYETYHNHKERMAYAGFLLQVALFSFLMTVETWPPPWVAQACTEHGIPWTANAVTFAYLLVIWVGIHRYIRWQLEMRRSAAIQVAATMRLLHRWAASLPSDDNLSIVSPEEAGQASYVERRRVETNLSGLGKALSFGRVFTLLRWVARQLDKCIPFPYTYREYDISIAGYPRDFAEILRNQYKKGTGAVKGEWLMFLGSLLFFAAISARTVFSK